MSETPHLHVKAWQGQKWFFIWQCLVAAFFTFWFKPLAGAPKRNSTQMIPDDMTIHHGHNDRGILSDKGHGKAPKQRREGPFTRVSFASVRFVWQVIKNKRCLATLSSDPPNASKCSEMTCKKKAASCLFSWAPGKLDQHWKPSLPKLAYS